MTAIAGLFGTGDWGTDERPKNFRETILWRSPNGDAPFTALMSKMGSESVDDPQFSWWEETLGLVRQSLHDATDDGTHTSLTLWGQGLDANAVASGALALVNGDLLQVESALGRGEILRVTANPANDTVITVQRGVAGTTAATIATGTYLTKIGSAFGEGATAPLATTKNPTKLTNYCQIFRTSYEITKTALKTYARTGDPLKNQKKRKMFAHARDQELAFIFGNPFETTDATTGKPLRYTGGMLSFITSNVTNFSGQGTAANQWGTDNLLAALAAPFTYTGDDSGDERIAFCGNSFLTKLNQVIKADGNSRITFDGVVSAYGMNLRKVITPQGVIYFKTHPLFNIHPVHTKSALLINPKGIKYRYLRDTNFEDNIEPPGADYLMGQWLSECGLELHHEPTFAFLANAGG